MRSDLACIRVLKGLTIVLTIALSSPARAEIATLRELFSKFDAGAQATVDHSSWNELLGKYVQPGADGLNRVDYAGFKAKGHAALRAYIAGLEKVDPRSLDRAERFAFLVNLYNSKTIEIVLSHYPIRSIKDISLGGSLGAVVTGGPWKANVVRIGGINASLDDIEHGVLRPLFNDPRVHYAVNCASIGCPNLGTEAFTGSKLEMQLDAAARAFINHPRGARTAGGQLTVSSIYDWFESDFGGSQEGVIKHLLAHAAPELKTKLNQASGIADYAYDWSLNDIER